MIKKARFIDAIMELIARSIELFLYLFVELDVSDCFR